MGGYLLRAKRGFNLTLKTRIERSYEGAVRKSLLVKTGVPYLGCATASRCGSKRGQRTGRVRSRPRWPAGRLCAKLKRDFESLGDLLEYLDRRNRGIMAFVIILQHHFVIILQHL
jgi:hypothetical protein